MRMLIIFFILFTSIFGYSQIECVPDTISSVCFNMDACSASFSNDSPSDYSEFTGDVINGPGGPSFTVVGGNIYRPEPEVNTHSCTPGQNNAAICVSSQDDCDFTDGSDKALQFDILVTPGSSGTGSISCLSFYEASPMWFNWINGSSGLNNYPQNFGVRVTIDEVEVFKEIDITTSHDWSINNFSFDTIPAFTVSEPTTFHFELLGYCTFGNGGNVNAWDVDEIKILYKEDGVPDGGQLTTLDGANSIELCEDETLSTLLSGEDGDNYSYVLTNGLGEILDIPTSIPIEVSITNEICYLWHLAYDSGLSGLSIGNNVLDIEGCFDFSDSIEIIKHFNPEIVSFDSTNTSCGENNGTITVNVAGGSGSYTYNWSDGSTSSMVSNLSAGTYTVIVTDSNGCDDEASVTIEPSTNPVASISKTDTTCGEDNGSATSSATGGSSGYSYTWSNGSNNATINNLSAGTYTVTVLDSEGCTDTESVTINGTTNPIASINGTDTTCGEDNGSATASATSGSGGYSYTWSNGSNNSIINNLSAGIYTVTVMDSEGCTDTESVTINATTNPIASINGIDTSCGEDNGSATSSATSGSGGYSYTWSNGSNNATINNLSAGMYTVTVMDSVGCTDTESVNIKNSTNPITSISGMDTSCGESNGSATASGTSGSGGYSYLWNNGATTATINNLAVDDYSVTITDDEGCTDTESITINASSSPIVSITKVDTRCGEDNGSANATATSGTGGYSYLWSNGATTAMVANLSSGIYMVTVTDNSDCIGVESVFIQPSSNPISSISKTDTSCGEDNGSAIASATSGSGGYSYTWSNGSNDSIINNLSAGIYTVTVMDSEGCTVTESITIDGSTNPIVSINGTDTSCGEDNGSVTASATSGSAGYSYTWSNGSNNATVNNLAAGSYTVTVTDTEGCMDTESVTIGFSSSPIAGIEKINTSCGENNGSATASATSGSGSYTYEWSNGETTAMISNLSVGVYTVTVTDTEGCTDTESITIDGSDSPIASINNIDTSCGEDNGAAVASAVGGTGGYSYEWSNGETTNSIDNLSAGSYTVTVTDNSNCIGIETIVIAPSSNPIASISKTDTSCSEDNGSATASATSGSGGYSYSWSNGSSSASIDNLSAGTYTVTVTDNEGCMDTESVTIDGSTNPIASISKVDTSCGENNGSATASVTSGSGAYSYSWSNGSNDAMIDNLSAGTYTVTVTDSEGCIVSESITINNSTNPIVSITKVDTRCGEDNGVATVSASSGSGGYSYSWSNGSTSETIDNLSSGSYTVTVTDSEGCTDTESVNINNSTNPIASISKTDTSCGENNGSATANATSGTGGYSYSWSNGSTNAMINNLSAGSYTVTITDSEGCMDAESITIGFSTNPVVSISKTDTSCGENNGTATASTTSGSGGYSYSWSNGSTNATINNLSAGSYTVTVLDSAGCTHTESITINNSANPVASITKADTRCGEDNGVATATAISGSGGYSYSWSNGANSATIDNLSPGSYTVTVTDSEGCTDSESVSINNSTNPIASINHTDTSCGEDNGSATVSATSGMGGYSYEWSSGSTNATINNLSAGSYTVTVTDSEGCMDAVSVTIGFSTNPSVSITATNTTCGDSNGSATASGDNGTGGYTYLWSNGATSATVTNLAAGDYTVTLTDSNACTTSGTITIDGSSSPILSVNTTNTNCGENDGSAMASSTGGVSPYSYEWSTGATSSAINNLTAGNYSATVTDQLGCTDIISFTILNSDSPLTSISGVSTSCGENNGSATTNVTGGTGGYSYSWSNGATTASLSNLSAGNYSLTVTDESGCESFDNITIGNSSNPQVSATTTHEVCTDMSGTISLIVTGGSGTYSYNWSNGSTDSELINLSAGNYSVTVTDTDGCTEIASYTVVNETDLEVVVAGTDTCCGENNGTAMVTMECGIAPYMISWSNGETSSSITNLTPGTYTVTVVDAIGDMGTGSVTVNGSTAPNVTIQGQDTYCGQNDGSASINISGGTAPYSIEWSNGVTGETDIDNLSAGTYSVTVTDQKDCTDQATIVIESSINPNAGNIAGGPFLFCIDGTPDYVSGISLNNIVGTNTTFIITDAAGNITAMPSSLEDLENYNFDAAATGVCFIYYLSYEDVTGLNLGGNVQNLNGCYDLAGAIEVEKVASESDSSTVLFDMDACSAGVDFDEFTAEIDNYNGCTSFDIIGDNLTAGFSHSCTPGVNGSLGMCFSADKSCDYDFSTDNKLVIDLEVTPGSFGTGSISGISFYEQAPSTFVWTDGTTGVNDYPTLYALRILKNGVMIFEDDDLSTSSSWSLAQFDFSAMPDFTVTAVSTFTIEMIPYCAVGNGTNNVSIWDVDEILIFSECDVPLAGGTLSGGPYSICLDGSADYITDLSISNYGGDFSSFLVTDEDGNILHSEDDLNEFSQINFDNGQEGTCYIWHLSSDNGFIGAEIGNNINSNLAGCYDLSNSIAITKMNCGNNNIMIYPNPTTNYVTIDISAFTYDKMRYELVDNLGRVIMQNKKYDNQESLINVDLSNLTEGRYYIKTVVDGLIKVTPIMLVK